MVAYVASLHRVELAFVSRAKSRDVKAPAFVVLREVEASVLRRDDRAFALRLWKYPSPKSDPIVIGAKQYVQCALPLSTRCTTFVEVVAYD